MLAQVQHNRKWARADADRARSLRDAYGATAHLRDDDDCGAACASKVAGCAPLDKVVSSAPSGKGVSRACPAALRLAVPPPSRSTALALRARAEFAFFDECPADDERSTDASQGVTGARWAFLENAGGSQVPRLVRNACAAGLDRRWRDETGARHKEQARIFLSDWLGCGESVAIGENASGMLFRLAQAARVSWISPGDNVVICEASHDANRLPWTAGEIREWKMDAVTGELSLASLRQLVDAKTKIVAVPHASNVTGLVYDVRSVVSCVRSAAPDALIVVDGVAYAAHRRIEFSKLGCDAYVVATHKAFGPHAAALCCSDKLSATLAEHAPNAGRMRLGAETSADWRRNPRCWELGTVSAEACAGMAALRQYLEKVATWDRHSKLRGHADAHAFAAAYDAISLAEAAPFFRLLAFLRANPLIDVLADAADPTAHALTVGRVPTVAFVHRRISPKCIVGAAAAERIAMRHGDFLSPKTLAALGQKHAEGVVRASLVHYNTLDDVDRLVERVFANSFLRPKFDAEGSVRGTDLWPLRWYSSDPGIPLIFPPDPSAAERPPREWVGTPSWNDGTTGPRGLEQPA
mmetsp:Transcript_30098/g.104006  ORF Transcript_30098/g.104006 Transcript_30098/m.104006 type:complete len:582 (-) Transcript_30098:23-1768(-)